MHRPYEDVPWSPTVGSAKILHEVRARQARDMERLQIPLDDAQSDYRIEYGSTAAVMDHPLQETIRIQDQPVGRTRWRVA